MEVCFKFSDGRTMTFYLKDNTKEDWERLLGFLDSKVMPPWLHLGDSSKRRVHINLDQVTFVVVSDKE